MVFDALPIYFDYAGETWLIEFWKGQYGINTGGEVGVYHAGKVVPERYYRIAHFEAVEDQDMPFIQCRLDRRRKKSLFPAEAALVADRIWDGDIFETIGSDIGDDNTVSE